MLGCHGVGAATSSIIRPSVTLQRSLCVVQQPRNPPLPAYLPGDAPAHFPAPAPAKSNGPSSGELMPSGLGVSRGGPRDILRLRSPRKVPKRPLAVPLQLSESSASKIACSRHVHHREINSIGLCRLQIDGVADELFCPHLKARSDFARVERVGTDARSAEREATAAARKILVDAINASRDDIPDRLIVTDGEGREVGSISLRDVLPKTLR